MELADVIDDKGGGGAMDLGLETRSSKLKARRPLSTAGFFANAGRKVTEEQTATRGKAKARCEVCKKLLQESDQVW